MIPNKQEEFKKDMQEIYRLAGKYRNYYAFDQIRTILDWHHAQMSRHEEVRATQPIPLLVCPGQKWSDGGGGFYFPNCQLVKCAGFNPDSGCCTIYGRQVLPVKLEEFTAPQQAPKPSGEVIQCQ
jgi:hypothetical protein